VKEQERFYKLISRGTSRWNEELLSYYVAEEMVN